MNILRAKTLLLITRNIAEAEGRINTYQLKTLFNIFVEQGMERQSVYVLLTNHFGVHDSEFQRYVAEGK